MHVASLDQLQKIAGTLPEVSKRSPTRRRQGQPFDLEALLRGSSLEVIGPQNWQDAKRWIFLVCPWDPAHANRSAFVVQFASGAIAAGCHHNGCQGKGWPELRDILQPGWRERIGQNGWRPAGETVNDPGYGEEADFRDVDGDMDEEGRDCSETDDCEGRSDAAAVEALIAMAERTSDPSPVYKAAPLLARLSTADLASAKSRLKKICPALNLNDLVAAIKAEGKRLADERREQRRQKQAAARAGLPSICVSERELHVIGDDALRVLEGNNLGPDGSPFIYVRGGALVRVLVNDQGRPVVKPLEPAALRRGMSETAHFFSAGTQGERPAYPPREVVEDVLARGCWPFPSIEAIVETPVLRPDGCILDVPGYDPATRLLYRPVPGFEWPGVKEKPTQQDVIQAILLIDEMIEGFPFVLPADRANAAGTLLTMVARPAINGGTPLAVFDAPMAGTGKGRLVEAFSVLGTGQAAPLMSQVESEEEWRKQLTTAFLSGSSIIVIDNVDAPLASGQLAKALTARLWRDRLLGTNKNTDVPIRVTWIATGNNVQLGGDMPRRCYWVRMDARHPQPWRRTGFRHPQLLEWVTKNRGPLLAAMLTMARGWYVAGCPEAETPVLGGFEEWSRTIGGILAFAGVEGFLDNLERMYEQASATGGQWEGFLLELHRVMGKGEATSRDIAALVFADETLRMALPDPLLAALARSRDTFTLALGKALPRQAEVRYAGVRVVRAGFDAHRKVPLWAVRIDQNESQGGLAV